MFERFTDSARRVVVLAQEEARALNHNYIGTEHLLLGLIREQEGVAAKVLESLGSSLEDVRSRVEEMVGEGKKPPSGHIPFTPRAKNVLELSLREALQLNHNYIGTEHVLLGLLGEGEGVAAQILMAQGLTLEQVRGRIRELLAAHEPRSDAFVLQLAQRLAAALYKKPGERHVQQLLDALEPLLLGDASLLQAPLPAPNVADQDVAVDLARALEQAAKAHRDLTEQAEQAVLEARGLARALWSAMPAEGRTSLYEDPSFAPPGWLRGQDDDSPPPGEQPGSR